MQPEGLLREIRTQGELDRLVPTFMRTLIKELDVFGLVSRMCPVLFSDSSAGIFVLSQHYHDDQTSALLHLLSQRGFRLNASPLFVLSPALLIAVTKSLRTTGAMSIQIQESSNNGSALSQAMSAILLWALEHRASDIHFNVKRNQTESAVLFTIDGRYVCPDR